MKYGEAIKNLENIPATNRLGYLENKICPLCPSTVNCEKGKLEHLQCLVQLAQNFTPMFDYGRPR